jgi:hypothetical protein
VGTQELLRKWKRYSSGYLERFRALPTGACDVHPCPPADYTSNAIWLYGYRDIVSSMKTTVDLTDQLLRDAQELARREGTTLKALIEAGLRAVLTQRADAPLFTLDDASVGGRGLQPAFRDAGWELLRDASYDRSA